MDPAPVRILVAALILPAGLAGCYTVLSHPKPEVGERLEAAAPYEGETTLASSECLRCHVGHAASDLDLVGRSWYDLERRRGYDPRWPSAYGNWLGYLPDPWYDYYRDPAWRDPWYGRDDRVIIVAPGDPSDELPHETGTRHLWGRRPPSGEPRPPDDPPPPADARSAPRPRAQPPAPAPEPQRDEPEEGERHLWGRGPR